MVDFKGIMKYTLELLDDKITRLCFFLSMMMGSFLDLQYQGVILSDTLSSNIALLLMYEMSVINIRYWVYNGKK